ncbi:ABC transporter permease [Thermohalobacter berrensis]|uniref:Transport permease protein n=1 Tax=Thermohalobacter berrensis TaxID=99594 RepID=A0A419T194_9FIRM|nr:ABC transporter permease [Thermohalobacter berrensis]RKD31237.1 transporter [Thermohalobacter berrensis]
MSFGRLITIVKKEFIHIKRDKSSLGIAIMMPLVFILIFGYAVNTDVEHIKMAILDQDKTLESRELIQKFASSNYFQPKIYVDNISEIERLLDKGNVKTGLIIPPNFSKDFKRGKSPMVQLIVDGTDPTIARTALQSGVLTGKMYSIKKHESIANKKGNILQGIQEIDVRTRVWYNPNLESNKFTIPGLIGLIMQNVTVMLTAFALVREKERGTIEQLIVTPIRSVELIIGKMIPYIVIGSVDFLIALFLGTYWFNVPIRGNILLLILLGFGFVICALAIGMLISTVASNQLQAMQMTIMIILPSVLLSGFIFPRESMPLIIQKAGYLIPLTYFLEILRGIILKGIGIDYLLKEIIILIIMGTLLLTIASIRFKKKLD